MCRDADLLEQSVYGWRCWRHNKLWFIEPGVTWLRAEVNTMPRWKSHTTGLENEQ